MAVVDVATISASTESELFVLLHEFYGFSQTVCIIIKTIAGKPSLTSWKLIWLRMVYCLDFKSCAARGVVAEEISHSCFKCSSLGAQQDQEVE